MKKLMWIGLLLVLLAACSAAKTEPQVATSSDEPTIVVYSSPTCGCCGDWMAHLEENGFTVETKPVQDIVAVKVEHGVPQKLYSCHTAVIDGYIIEGHVPADDIYRLLEDRPAVAGLGVAGMPIGSPGMESEDAANQAYDVIAFGDAGTSVFASYAP